MGIKVDSQMATEIALNTLGASESLANLTRAVNSATSAWKSQETALKVTGDYLEASRIKYEGLGSTIERQEQKISKIKEKQQGLNVETIEGAKAYARYHQDLEKAEIKLTTMTAQQEKARKAYDLQKSGIIDLRRDMELANKTTQAYVELLKVQGKETDALKAKQNGLRESLTKQNDLYKKEYELLQKVKKESGETSETYKKQVIKVSELGVAFEKTKKEIKETQTAINKVSPAGIKRLTQGAEKAAKASEKMTATFKSGLSTIKSVSAGAGLALLPIGAAAIKGAKDASELQDKYVKINNLLVTGGEKQIEVTKNVAEMQKEGKRYSIEYGVSQEKIAEGYKELVKRGYSSEQALGTLKTMLQGSVAAGDDFNDVVHNSTATLESFGLKTDNTAGMLKASKKVVNEMAYAADMTATDFIDMGTALSYAGATAHGAGISLGETATAVGVLSNNGLEADKAGTGLRKTLVSLQNPTNEGTAALQRIGLSTKDFVDQNGKMKSITEIFGLLNQHTSTMSKFEKGQFFHTLFGTTGQQAGAILAANVDQLDKLNKKVQESYKGQGYVAELSKKNMASVKAETAQFEEAGESVLITVGKKLLPVLRDVTVSMTKAFNSKDGQEALSELGDTIADVSEKGVKLAISSGKWISSHKPEITHFLKETKKEAVELFDDGKIAVKGFYGIAKPFLGLIEKYPKQFGEIIAAMYLAKPAITGLNTAASGFAIFKQASVWVKDLSVELGILSEEKNIVPTLKLPNAPGGAIASNVGNAASEIAEGTSAASTAGALGKIGIFGKISAATEGLTKLVPYIGLLGSLPELFKQGSVGQKTGGFAGSVGGTAAGAALGTAILPGIGTALGAAAGSWVGGKFGEGFGDSIQKTLDGKPLKPKLEKVDLKVNTKVETSYDVDKISRSLQPTIKQLNKKLLIKMSFDPASGQKTKKQTDQLFDELTKKIDGYYANKETKSKKDFEFLVKQGLMTQKEADKQLKSEKTKDDTARKQKQQTLTRMKSDTDAYYSNVAKIQNNSTLSEKQKEKKLNDLHKSFVSTYVKDEYALNAKAAAAIQKGAKEQESVYQQLLSKKGKLSASDLAATQKNADKLYNAAVKPARKTRDDIVATAKDKYNKQKATADHEYKDLGTISKDQYNDIVSKAKKQKDDTTSAANDQYKNVTDQATKQHNKVTSEIKKQKEKVVEEANKQAAEHAGASQTETQSVQGSWDGMKKNLSSIVEAVAHGIGTLIHSLNKGWGKGLMNFKFGAHAKGSSGLSHDEIALVGEEGMELAHHPSRGIFPVGLNGPEIRPLSAGTSILPHDLSTQFLAMTKGLPAHADGVWGTVNNIFDWVKDKAKDVEGFVGEGAEKIYDTVTEKIGISKFLGELGDSATYKTAKGSLDYAKGSIVKYAQGLFDKYTAENSLGTGSRAQFVKIAEAQGDKPYVWGAEGPNAFDCSGLVKWSLGQLGISFPHYSGAQFSETSAISENQAKPGDLAFYGPGGDEHVGIVTGKNRMFAAQSPSSHPNIGPDSIHNGLPFSGIHRINQLSSGGGSSGTGVDRWRTQVIAALKANKLPSSAAYVNAWLRQIQTESGGNEKAVGGNDGLAEGNATGLLQTKPGTFAAYAFPGHRNIFNGYDDMLAAIAYAKATYGPDMLSVIGQGHGYANGGEIRKHGLYEIAEGNKSEFVIPTDIMKRSRGWQLIGQVISRFVSDDPSLTHAASQTVEESKEYKELTNKFDLLLARFDQLLGLSASQLQAIKEGSFDKTALYKQQASDQALRGYQRFQGGM